jgi:hypothetical protein
MTVNHFLNKARAVTSEALNDIGRHVMSDAMTESTNPVAMALPIMAAESRITS